MNVLSLFDGMSCGQIALERIGVKVDNYFASEIDKYAIKVTMANYPNTIQLGDVTKVNGKDLPKIDLLIGGSPCQGFSFAGKRLNFDDERSKLFFEFVRILKETNPMYFLLENVEMKYEHELVISKYMGVNPIVINSTLVSAQNRVRNYWTNINSKPYGLFGDVKPDIPQPKDKGILLKDILEKNVAEKYYLSEKRIKLMNDVVYGQTNKLSDVNGKSMCLSASMCSVEEYEPNIIDIGVPDKSYCIDANYAKGTTVEQYLSKGRRQLVQVDAPIITHNMLPRSSKNGRGGTGHLQKNDGKSYCLDTNSTTNAIEFLKEVSPYQGDKLHFDNGKMQCLSAQGGNNLRGIGYSDGKSIRRLTEIECERLQTVPDNYTNHVSSTQRYKMLGNGWTVDVVAHIFKHLPKEYFL